MKPAPVIDGRRLDGASKAHPGECTYTVVVQPIEAAEKRHGQRQRTRLRTGKVIDAAGRFLTECLVYDRSETGGRLRLPARIALPGTIQLYEDQSAALLQADVVWRLEREVGIRFRHAAPTARSRALEAEMRRRFYAVPG